MSQEHGTLCDFCGREFGEETTETCEDCGCVFCEVHISCVAHNCDQLEGKP